MLLANWQRPNFPAWGQSLSENWPQNSEGTFLYEDNIFWKICIRTPEAHHRHATKRMKIVKLWRMKKENWYLGFGDNDEAVLMESIVQQSWTNWGGGWKPCNLYHLQITIAAAHRTLAPIGNILKLDDPSISQNSRRWLSSLMKKIEIANSKMQYLMFIIFLGKSGLKQGPLLPPLRWSR